MKKKLLDMSLEEIIELITSSISYHMKIGSMHRIYRGYKRGLMYPIYTHKGGNLSQIGVTDSTPKPVKLFPLEGSMGVYQLISYEFEKYSTYFLKESVWHFVGFTNYKPVADCKTFEEFVNYVKDYKSSKTNIS